MTDRCGAFDPRSCLPDLFGSQSDVVLTEPVRRRIQRVRGAIFDLDGTLLDSAGMWTEVDRRFLERRGIVMPEDYTRAIHSMEFAQTAVYTAERFGLADTPEEMMQEWTELARSAYADEILLKPNAKKFLQALKNCGIRLAVATSSKEELFSAALSRNGIDRLFDAYATTREAGAGKETPAVYCRAAEKLALEPAECAVFEDISVGIQSAKRAGFFTVGVFDEGSREQWEAITKVADICLKAYV